MRDRIAVKPSTHQALSQGTIHLPYVDGLRGLVALYVVLCHAWLQTWPQGVYGDEPSGWVLRLTGWLNLGGYSVVVFIVISGFCLMLPVLNREGTLGKGGVRRFFIRRARRILPPYYAALALSLLLAFSVLAGRTHSLYDLSRPINAEGIVSHILLVHNLQLSTVNQISVPLWSIAVECQIYLLFPILLLIRRHFGNVAVLGGTYLVGVVASDLVSGTPYVGIAPAYTFYFALGMFAAETIRGPRSKLHIWIGGVAAVVLLAFGMKPPLLETLWAHTLVAIVAMCLLIVCAHWPANLIAKFCSWRPVVGLGTFSYSLYLVHFPIQQLVWQYLVKPSGLGPVVTFSIMATIGTGMIVFVAYLFYLAFERPFTTQAYLAARKLQAAPDSA